jgi:plastocyanin
MNRNKILVALAIAASVAGLNASAADSSPNAYGNNSPAGSAGRVVEITPATKYVNVTDGDTVTFKIDGRDFTWTFHVLHQEGVVQLSSILPQDLHADGVKVYVTPDLSYR